MSNGKCKKYEELTPKERLLYIDRFWEFVDKKDASECWEWKGWRSPNGYGKYRESRAHRVSWMIHFGPIPSDGSYHGLCVCHRCDNRGCVNPAHLFLATHYENMQDMVTKGRRKGIVYKMKGGGTRRDKGIAYRYTTKLTAEQVIEIKSAIAAKRLSLRKIAQMYDVSRTTIWLIKKDKMWKDIVT